MLYGFKCVDGSYIWECDVIYCIEINDCGVLVKLEICLLIVLSLFDVGVLFDWFG